MTDGLSKSRRDERNWNEFRTSIHNLVTALNEVQDAWYGLPTEYMDELQDALTKFGLKVEMGQRFCPGCKDMNVANIAIARAERAEARVQELMTAASDVLREFGSEYEGRLSSLAEAVDRIEAEDYKGTPDND